MFRTYARRPAAKTAADHMNAPLCRMQGLLRSSRFVRDTSVLLVGIVLGILICLVGGHRANEKGCRICPLQRSAGDLRSTAYQRERTGSIFGWRPLPRPLSYKARGKERLSRGRATLALNYGAVPRPWATGFTGRPTLGVMGHDSKTHIVVIVIGYVPVAVRAACVVPIVVPRAAPHGAAARPHCIVGAR